MSYNSPISQDSSDHDGLIKSFADTCHSLRVRYISTQGHFFNFHLNWLQQIFTNLEIYDFNSQESFALSIAERDYDVLFVGARDASRIIKFAKMNARALNSRVRFAIMDQTDPPRRAAVLNAGFDDIFDLSRTVPDEAMMRIASVWRRHQQAQELHTLKTEQQAALSSVTTGSDLAPSEERLLRALCERIGRIVSYQKLINICSKDHEPITFTHLRVLTSHARRKLAAGYQIRSVNGQGYGLFAKENNKLICDDKNMKLNSENLIKKQ